MFVTRTLVLSIAVAFFGPQSSNAPFDLNAVAQKAERAQLSGDVAGLKAARAACLTALTAGKAADRTLVRYTMAFIDWRIGFNPNVPAREQDAMFDEAIDQLTQAIKDDPAFAEAYALLSSAYGGKISKDPDLGMTLGMRAGEMLGKAQSLAPGNPRVLLTQGVSAFNTPPEYGGSVEQAEQALRRATAIFDNEPADKPWPNWGRFDAHAWLGQVLAKRGDVAGAKAEYDRALEIAPGSGWVKYVLVPALKKVKR